MDVAESEVIDRYFRAVAEDHIDALVGCFADDASVADENKIHRGRDEIGAWREQTKWAYQYTAEVLNSEQRADGRGIVTARQTGNSPGSPIDLNYLFTISGKLIGRLDIDP